MANVAVIGAQWGDEGKGKIVDWLSRARRRGGALPGRPQCRPHPGHRQCRIQAEPACPRAWCARASSRSSATAWWSIPGRCSSEIEAIRAKGVTVTPAIAARRRQRDADPALARRASTARARRRAATGKIGTTGRGIGPAYEDKVGRRAHPPVRSRRSREPRRPSSTTCCCTTTRCCAGSARPKSIAAPLLRSLREIAPKVLPYADRCGERLDEARRARQAHSVRGRAGRDARCRSRHLSLRHLLATPSPARPPSGSGIGTGAVGYVLGITKAYTTRVGSGPFPTELTDEIGQTLGERGKEFGVVTGRKRRCGWFDAVLVRQAVKIGGIDGIALTKLDVLDGFAEIKICVGYRLRARPSDYLPAGTDRPGCGRAGLRNLEGLERNHARRARLGRASGIWRSNTSAASKS